MSKELSVEELLKPRYKVIASYPGSDFEIGRIFFSNVKYYDKYPHLFKKLKWYEDRDVEEMPMYVELINEDLLLQKVFPKYMRVTWEIGTFSKDELVAFNGEYLIHRTYIIPCTQKEYLLHLKLNDPCE